jgi:putative ABC transport system ATP-binding protein
MLELNHLMPIPLRDRLSKKESSVWNNQILVSTEEWIKITAPSGTGKTTLMHMLYGIRTDYDGAILLDGINIKNMSINKLASIRQIKMSVIFQDLRLFSHLTAFENIELKRVLQKPYYESDKIIEMAELLGISNILSQKAAICSYGEQQRISIIRALIQPFTLLLMDEPFSHLDNNNKAIAAKLIAQECIKRNAALIITDLEDDDLFTYSRKLIL